MASDGSKPKKMNAEEILRTLEEIRKGIRRLDPNAPAAAPGPEGLADDRSVFAGANDGDAEEDFEQLAIVDGLSTIASELRETLDRMNAKVYQDALNAYYAAEELAKDPAHADLIPRLEEMRRAHQQSYGKPIPPKPPKSDK